MPLFPKTYSREEEEVDDGTSSNEDESQNCTGTPFRHAVGSNDPLLLGEVPLNSDECTPCPP
jgi:hypothetical protein